LTTEFDGSTVRLVMAKVTKTDGAIYKCIAENEAGKDQIKSKLTVKGDLLTFCINLKFYV